MDPSRAPTQKTDLTAIAEKGDFASEIGGSAVKSYDGRLPSMSFYIVRYVCLLCSMGLTLAVLLLILARFHNHGDSEWVESSMARSALHILNGKSLYGPPTVDYVGDNYPPLYFFLCAVVMKMVGPTLMACRAVSIVSTVAVALAIWVIGNPRSNIRDRNKHWHLRVVCVGLFFAFFAAGGQVYDLARVDMTAIALAAWAIVVSLKFNGRWSPVIAGALMGLAILTKHNMVMVGIAIGLGLLLDRRRQALIYGSFSAGLPLLVFGILQTTTDGWSGFYLFTQPSLHPFGGTGRWIRFLADDLSHHGLLLVIGLIAGGTVLLRKRVLCTGDDRSRLILMLLVALGGLLVTMVARLKAGGFSNNLCPMWIFGLMAMAWMLPRLSNADKNGGQTINRFQWVVWPIVTIQLLSLSTSFLELPWRSWLAGSEREKAVNELKTVVAHYSANGPVWVPAHSFDPVAERSFAHLCPAGFLMDAPQFPAKSMFETELATHLERKTWSAIILDDTRNQFVSDRCTRLLTTNYEEIEFPIENPEAGGTLTGKRTYPRRLFIRRKVRLSSVDTSVRVQ